MNSIHWLVAALVTSSIAFAQLSANVPPYGEERVFAEHCAVCHENPATRAPRVFIGSQNGHVYSLDAQSSCYHWDYKASTGVRTAVTVARIGGRSVALFGGKRADRVRAAALRAESGRSLF